MILENKCYSEEFAVNTFNTTLKEDVINDCKASGFAPNFDDLNHVILGSFIYHNDNYRLEMDVINASIHGFKNEEEVMNYNFAGLTDHYLFIIGKDGIVDESEYGYVFCDMYNHIGFGMSFWIADLIDVDVLNIPRSEIEILNKYNV